MVSKEILERKGPRKLIDINPKVLRLLNQGIIASVNLTEWLAIDHKILIAHCFPKMGIPESAIKTLLNGLEGLKQPTAMNSIKCIGPLLYLEFGELERPIFYQKLSSHASDTIRCYATYLIAYDQNMELLEKLEKIRILAADHHFGVREVAWMAMRPEIDANLQVAIQAFTKWAEDPDENIRRFASESTRPRGVWCKHIEVLKQKPEIALPILEKLKSDPSKYVQDSVGNWLNDASKSKPDFVLGLCKKWQKVSPTKSTEKIIKKARRTLDKM